jgi:hypothetical protein
MKRPLYNKNFDKHFEPKNFENVRMIDQFFSGLQRRFSFFPERFTGNARYVILKFIIAQHPSGKNTEVFLTNFSISAA